MRISDWSSDVCSSDLDDGAKDVNADVDANVDDDDDDFGDFGDFEGPSAPIQEVAQAQPPDAPEGAAGQSHAVRDDDDFGDFGNFESTAPPVAPVVTTSAIPSAAVAVAPKQPEIGRASCREKVVQTV